MPRIGVPTATAAAASAAHGLDLQRHPSRVARAWRQDDEVGQTGRDVGGAPRPAGAPSPRSRGPPARRGATASRRSRRGPRERVARRRGHDERLAGRDRGDMVDRLPGRAGPRALDRDRPRRPRRARSPRGAPRRCAAGASARACRCPRSPGCRPRPAARRATGPGPAVDRRGASRRGREHGPASTRARSARSGSCPAIGWVRTTIWPAYEGSVRISPQPVAAVVKTRSPSAGDRGCRGGRPGGRGLPREPAGPETTPTPAARSAAGVSVCAVGCDGGRHLCSFPASRCRP